jgi:hypothetical protein
MHDENTSGVVDKIFIEILIRYRFYLKIFLYGHIRFVSLLSYPNPSEVKNAWNYIPVTTVRIE